MLPPGVLLSPMSQTLTVSALAHAARLTVPRITAASWQPELLELLLYTIRLPAEIPATVRVCDPQGSVTDAIRLGSLGSLMSKTCTPSHPAATVWPSQVLASGFLEFQDRTRMLFHTMMSPWSPLQCCQTTSCGLSGSEMSMTRNPS